MIFIPLSHLQTIGKRNISHLELLKRYHFPIFRHGNVGQTYNSFDNNPATSAYSLYENSYYSSAGRSGGQPAPPSGLYGHYPEHGYYGDSDVISRKRKSHGHAEGRDAEKRSMLGYNYALVGGYDRLWLRKTNITKLKFRSRTDSLICAILVTKLVLKFYNEIIFIEYLPVMKDQRTKFLFWNLRKIPPKY